MDWIEIALEEYKSVRAESFEAIKTQQITLQIGITLVGAAVIAGLNLWKTDFLSEIIFLIFTPVLCYITLEIWIGEVARMMRAGYFASLIEKKISNAFPDHPDVLSFENWLRKKKKSHKTPQNKWNYIAVIGLFPFISVSSIFIGNVKIINEISITSLIMLDIIESIFIIVFLFHIYSLSKKFLKDQY